MDQELIEKEKNYHKLNNELEAITKELMKEIDTVYEKLDCCTENDLDKKTQSVTDNNKKNNIFSFRSETLSKIMNMNPRKEAKPELNLFKKTISNDRNNSSCNSIFLLKERGNILQSELLDMKSLYFEKVTDYNHLQSNYKKLEKELDDMKRSNLKLNRSQSTWERNLAVITNKLEIYEAENKSLKNEVESLKNLLNQTKTKDAYQLKQLLLEVERLNRKLLQSDGNKKCSKHNNSRTNKSSKNHDKEHKSDTTNLLKKQIELILNLKKQKHLIEIFQPLKISENKFLKIFNFDH